LLSKKELTQEPLPSEISIERVGLHEAIPEYLKLHKSSKFGVMGESDLEEDEEEEDDLAGGDSLWAFRSKKRRFDSQSPDLMESRNEVVTLRSIQTIAKDDINLSISQRGGGL